MKLRDDLASIISGEAGDDETILMAASRDASMFQVKPSVVVWPKNSADITALVKYVTAHRDQRLSLAVRAGGTCMSGGSLTESIVVDVSKHLNRVIKVGDHTAIAEPGTPYRELARAAAKRNLLLPSYPASKDICTVGGMVNNNAGGEKTLAYGKTERYVKELKAVLADGKEYVLRPLSPSELAQKMEQQNFEGDIYRGMHRLIATHDQIIRAARPPVSKNSTGYALWNVWDKKKFDLSQLFVGSQGTLGITTEISFSLVTPKPEAIMIVMFLREITPLADIVGRILRYQPESFESYDHHTLRLALKFLPYIFRRSGSISFLSLLLQFIPELKIILTGSLPRLILIAEFTGYDRSEVKQRAQAALASVRQYPIKTRLVTSPKEAQKYWVIRHESFNLLRQKIKKLHTVPFIDDLVVAPRQLPDFLPRIEELLAPYNITYTMAGHIGDANFHIIPLMDLSDPKQRQLIPELAEKVYSLVFQFKGSMSGEHNDGLIRSPFLKQMYGDEVYNLFVHTKQIFDPNNIFNPGKKVGASWEYAMNHLISE